MSSFDQTLENSPPFDPHIHIVTAEPTDEQKAIITEFRKALTDVPLYLNHMEWADDTQLFRFLIARNFNLSASLELMKSALKWREQRQPSSIEQSHHWPDKISKESETGKIYCPGHDKWGRSVIVFDNTVQNTNCVDGQMTFLAWNLEFAIKTMRTNVDKYLVFMHLGGFSFFNTPPMASTKETIHMLCNCFPERLGHCIAYQPPTIFRVFYNTIKSFLDPKTVSKIVFISGDVSEGSENDLKMRQIVGDNWKVLVGVEQPVVNKCSPGYVHDDYWPTVIERLESLSGKSIGGICSGSNRNEANTAASCEEGLSSKSNITDISSVNSVSGKEQQWIPEQVEDHLRTEAFEETADRTDGDLTPTCGMTDPLCSGVDSLEVQ